MVCAVVSGAGASVAGAGRSVAGASADGTAGTGSVPETGRPVVSPFAGVSEPTGVCRLGSEGSPVGVLG